MKHLLVDAGVLLRLAEVFCAGVKMYLKKKFILKAEFLQIVLINELKVGGTLVLLVCNINWTSSRIITRCVWLYHVWLIWIYVRSKLIINLYYIFAKFIMKFVTNTLYLKRLYLSTKMLPNLWWCWPVQWTVWESQLKSTLLNSTISACCGRMTGKTKWRSKSLRLNRNIHLVCMHTS